MGPEITVGLLLGDFLYMNAPLLTIDCADLAFSAFESSSHDLDSVALADRDGAHFILGLQILTQVAAHDLSSEVGGSTEMGLS